jgi:uncharacterized protein (TIGR02118 family)
MPTKITVIYDNPTDTTSFEAIWAERVMDLAERLPGLQRIETSKVWPKEDGSPTPAYRMIELYFLDYDAASNAVTTAEAAALFPVLGELGSAGVKFVFFDVEEHAQPRG